MSANAQKIQRTIADVAKRWPKDALRPKLQFGQAIAAANERIFSNELTPTQLQKAQSMSESLQRLLDNSALRSHPMQDKITTPASYPQHYQALKEGIARAERGEQATSFLVRLLGRR